MGELIDTTMSTLHTIESNVTQMLGSAMNRNATSKEFIFKYWQRFDGLGTRLDSKKIAVLSDPGSIIRSKRRFAALDPKYAPNKEVQRRRILQEAKLRKHYSQ